MSAHLENRDLQVGLEMAWHGKTIVAPIVTRELAFPYEIERQPIFSQSGEKIPGWSVFVCDDDRQIAGKPVADTYVALHNSRFWEIIVNSLGGEGIVESAGTIYNRSRRFATVRLFAPGEEFRVGDRVFKQRLTLLDSIDGSTNFYGLNTSTCVVCANTFRMAMEEKGGEFRFKLRHTKGLISGIENMEKAIDNLAGVSAKFQAFFTQANTIPVSQVHAREAFAGFLADDKGSELSTRSLNTVGRLTSLFRGGAGNRGETLLDAISAVTDFYSHESSGGEEKPGFREKQTLSSEYGAGARAKTEFLGTVARETETGIEFAPESWCDLLVKGRATLARTESVLAN